MNGNHELKQQFPPFIASHFTLLTRRVLVEGETKMESKDKVGEREKERGPGGHTISHKHPKCFPSMEVVN